MDPRKQLAINHLADRVTHNLREIFGTRDSKHAQAWEDYGYKQNLEFNDYYQMSERFGVASAGITIPVEQSWKTLPKVLEGEIGEADEREDDTPWETKVSAVFNAFKLWRKLKLADEYQRVGEYGAFAIQVKGTAQQADWSQPLGS
jgi:hypothetical protein